MSQPKFQKPSITKIGKEYLAARRRYVPLKAEDEEDVKGKVILITGSNSGIGELAAKNLAKRGAIIIMCCRDVSKAEKVKQQIKLDVPEAQLDLIALDLGDLRSIRECVDNIKQKYDKIHILINNAGVLFRDNSLHKTRDGFEAHMGINHLGGFLFTLLLLDLVKASTTPELPSRIVFVGSSAHQFAELDVNDLMLEKRGKTFGQNNHGPYANSKLANMYFAKELNKRIAGSGVLVNVLCPGYIKTDIFRHSSWFDKVKTNLTIFLYGSSLETGTDVIVYCAISKNIRNEENGQMYRFNHLWKDAMDPLDDKFGSELWEKSEKLVGLE